MVYSSQKSFVLTGLNSRPRAQHYDVLSQVLYHSAIQAPPDKTNLHVYKSGFIAQTSLAQETSLKYQLPPQCTHSLLLCLLHIISSSKIIFSICPSTFNFMLKALVISLFLCLHLSIFSFHCLTSLCLSFYLWTKFSKS